MGSPFHGLYRSLDRLLTSAPVAATEMNVTEVCGSARSSRVAAWAGADQIERWARSLAAYGPCGSSFPGASAQTAGRSLVRETWGLPSPEAYESPIETMTMLSTRIDSRVV